MQVIIIEDEEFAARRLERMILEIDPDIQIVAKLESVAESVKWFKSHDTPDLIFMDNHLEDNLSYAIFHQISISCPIIFTTATDELSTQVFKANKLDFLLKPIVMEELTNMLEKYKNLSDGKRIIVDASFFKDILNKTKR
jgi:response regulator of citrate/malate metabolism